MPRCLVFVHKSKSWWKNASEVFWRAAAATPTTILGKCSSVQSSFTAKCKIHSWAQMANLLFNIQNVSGMVIEANFSSQSARIKIVATMVLIKNSL